MKIPPVLSNSFLLMASFLNVAQDGQTKAQEIDPPQASKDISEGDYKKSLFSIKEETVGQMYDEKTNSTWIITYTLKYKGDKDLTLSPSDITMEYSGENLSNSRHQSHSLPRTTDPKQVPYTVEKTEVVPITTPGSLFPFSIPVTKTETKYKLSYAEPTRPIKLKANETDLITIIPSSNDRQKCREKVNFTVKEYDIYKSGGTEDKRTTPIYSDLKGLEPLKLKPGSTFQLVTKIEHDHFMAGRYDPLLGDRFITVNLGDNKIISNLSLNREVNPAQVIPVLNTLPKERIFNTDEHKNTPRETIAKRQGEFLYLAADIPGYQYYRFDDMHIRGGDRFKLSFDYCVAIGTEGDCHVRIMEYQDTPNAWYRLEGGFDAKLGHDTNSIHLATDEIDEKKEGNEETKTKIRKQNNEVKERVRNRLNGDKYKLIFEKSCSTPPQYNGRWQHFECEIYTRSDTTTFALDFRMVGANVGEMWLDNVKLENLSTEKEPNRYFYRTSSLNPSVTISQKVALAK